MSENYDRHEMKIIRRGVSVKKVIAAYRYFGSLRKAASACGISKDTVNAVLLRYEVEKAKHAVLPASASYNPKTRYSDFAKWHKAHADEEDLPHSVSGLAALAKVNPNVVKCYFYRRRQGARKILRSMPNLMALPIILEDIEGARIKTSDLADYHFAIDRYSEKAVLQGHMKGDGAIEVTVLIPSIEVFASRVKKATSKSERLSPQGKPSSSLPGQGSPSSS